MVLGSRNFENGAIFAEMVRFLDPETTEILQFLDPHIFEMGLEMSEIQ